MLWATSELRFLEREKPLYHMSLEAPRLPNTLLPSRKRALIHANHLGRAFPGQSSGSATRDQARPERRGRGFRVESEEFNDVGPISIRRLKAGLPGAYGAFPHTQALPSVFLPQTELYTPLPEVFAEGLGFSRNKGRAGRLQTDSAE